MKIVESIKIETCFILHVVRVFFLTDKGTPTSVTSTLSSEIFLRWISKKYFPRVSAFSRVGLCFRLIDFCQLGDLRYYSQTLQFQVGQLIRLTVGPLWLQRKTVESGCSSWLYQFLKINLPKIKAHSRKSRDTWKIFFAYPSLKNF